MNPNWAEENLQTIRTLMERSALYRRALAPIMLYVGMIGIAAAVIGIAFHFNSIRMFGFLWLSAAAIAVAIAFLVARRQAIKDKENFWSSPTLRIAQALALPLAVGMLLSLALIFSDAPSDFTSILTFMWILFYGCALYSAGFFMPRGIKFFGLLFVIADLLLIFGLITNLFSDWLMQKLAANLLMGFFFGVLHLLYGIYLYFTEKKNSAA